MLATLVLAAPVLAEQPEPYVPAPANQIPGYSETVFPCIELVGWKTRNGTIVEDDEISRDVFDLSSPAAAYVQCSSEPHLEKKSLRELSILRNTIFARYGWGGFRKKWLREYFQQQPWYTPDPKFSYKRLTPVDRQNVELIAKAELSLRYTDLERMRDELLGAAGKWWGDIPSYEGTGGKPVYACDLLDYKGETTDDDGSPLYWVKEFKKAVAGSKDCSYHVVTDDDLKKHRSNKPVSPDLSQLGSNQAIELGLISRAMGDFAADEGQREQVGGSLDKVLSVKELRQLSLRDLRLLRNTIFARRGRPFKSKLLQEHFARMPWYKVDTAYSDKLLTATDKRNIQLIRQVEEEFGGALQDKDFQVENPSEAGDVVPPETTA